MAKVRLQWKPSQELLDSLSNNERKKIMYRSAMDVLRKAYKQHGLRGWFIGLETQISKAVLSQAILFATREQVQAWAALLFRMSTRVNN
jgi:adenine nucleotide transporter 17